MSALAIVVVSLVGAFAYCGVVVYLYMRLKWHMKTRDRYAMGEAAFFAAAVLPVGLCLLAVYSSGGVDGNGMPPRAVRRERTIKQQEAEIARLERELDLR